MNKSKILAAACAYKQKSAKKILKRARVYHAKNRYRRCTDMQRRHELAEPKTYTQDMYIVQLIGKILSDGSSLAKVIKAFKAHHEKVANKMTGVTLKRAVSGIAAKRLVKRVLLLRRHHVGALLRATRSITS